MIELGEFADRAKNCLTNGDFAQLANLMDSNFAMRRKLYGDAVVGATNIAAVNMATNLGFAAKFTGSGGAILCMHRSSPNAW